MGKGNIKHLNQLTRNSPFYQKLSQRRYSHVKGYADYDAIIFEIARMLTSYQHFQSSFFEEDFTHRTSVSITHEAYVKGFGSYWLSSQLFDAFCNSRLPKNLHSFQRVIPLGLLLFPAKLKNPDGQYLKWVLFHHRLANEVFAPIPISNTILTFEDTTEDSLAWSTMLDNGVQYAVNRLLKIENAQLNYENYSMYIPDDVQTFGINIDTATEQEFTDKVTDLILQTLLYLQLSSPNILEINNNLSKQKIKGNSKQKLQPYIIGENYQIKFDKPQATTASHKSPITHWRMGHYRNQPYGTREQSKYKTIWIEPMLINN